MDAPAGVIAGLYISDYLFVYLKWRHLQPVTTLSRTLNVSEGREVYVQYREETLCDR